MLSNMRHLPIRPLLDRDPISAGDAQIDGGKWSGYVKWHLVMMRDHCDLISSNLIGSVAIRGHAICAHNDGRHISGFEEIRDHAVQDQSGWKFVVDQLESGEASALVVGPRFCAVNVLQTFQLVELSDHSQRCSISKILLIFVIRFSIH